MLPGSSGGAFRCHLEDHRRLDGPLVAMADFAVERINFPSEVAVTRWPPSIGVAILRASVPNDATIGSAAMVRVGAPSIVKTARILMPERLDRDGEVALQVLHLSRQAIEPTRERGLAAIGFIGRQERCNSCLGDQRLRLGFLIGEVIELCQ
jgi:hypothetical protein